MKSTRVRALVAGVVAATGSAMVAFAPPADAAVTTTQITTPTNGAKYWVTDASPSAPVTIKGTSSGGVAGDLLDVRCYYSAYSYNTLADDVPIAANGSFTTTMSTDDPYGVCRLRAVPDGWPSTSGNVGAFSGPLVTTNWNTRTKISSGPNAGKLYDYYYLFQNSKAMNDYVSATHGGLWDSRLNYVNGTSSGYLWYGNAGVLGNDHSTRSGVQVDGANAFGPYAAANINGQAPGFPQLSVTISRTPAGVTTIREVNPLVKCNTTEFPVNSANCTAFSSTGVRLERTIVTTDNGLQVLVTDTWRSTDGNAHELSTNYDHYVGAQKYTSTGQITTNVGLRRGWSGFFETFTSDTNLGGTTKVPNTVFVRNDNTAPDPSTMSPRGAVTFDFGITSVRRSSNRNWALQRGFLAVPAGGKTVLRQHFVMAANQADVNAKAAAARVRLHPFRADTLLKKAGTKPFVGNGVYNASAAGQLLTTASKRSRTVTFVLAVQNDGTTASNFRVRGPGSRPGFDVKYLKGAAGSTRITGAVTGGTYRVGSLAPGGQRFLRLVVTVKPGANLGALSSWLVRSTSTRDAASTDVVKARIRVVR